MTLAEQAWIVDEWLGGRSQVEIARLLNRSASNMCSHIAKFCRAFGFSVDLMYDNDRRKIAAECLRLFYLRGEPAVRPQRLPLAKMGDWKQGEARAEYAFMLRCEGLTYQQIADRFDVSASRAQQMTRRFSFRVRHALRRTHFRIEVAQ